MYLINKNLWCIIRGKDVLGTRSLFHPLSTRAPAGIKNFLWIQVPVFFASFNEAGDDYEHQHQDIDAGEYFIHQRRLFDPDYKQSCSQ